MNTEATDPFYHTPAPRSSAVGRVTPSVSGTRLLGAVLIWIVAAGALGAGTFAIAQAVAPEWAANANELTAIIVAEVYAVLIATLVLLFRGERADAGLALRATPAREYVIAFAAIFAVIAVVGGALALMGQGAALGAAYERLGTDGDRLGTMGAIATVLSILRAGGLAPLGEEMLFRGVLFGWIEARTGKWAAVVGSGLLFGLLSIGLAGPVLLPLYVGFGLVLGWTRARSGSTLPAIAVHAAHNTAVIFVYSMAGAW